ncbi:MAG: flagellar basal body-associated protein FliL, partial [Pseudomonas sp.]|nr:flagellar basal body-associated protein FliL [Pseudomonas sp.]
MVTPLRALFLGLLMMVSAHAFAHKEGKDVRGLNNVTVLIVRHAEKPDEGPLLSPKGEQRAAAYASYFDPLL